MNILFICTGNTCRSPMAEGILRDLRPGISVRSGGIFTLDGARASENSILVMDELAIDIRGHRTRQISQEMLDWADLVLTMSTGHREAILNAFNIREGKIYTLADSRDITDPYGLGVTDYRRTRDEIKGEVERWIKKLKI